MSQFKEVLGTCQLQKRAASFKHLTSWWNLMSPYSMTCKVLPQGRCKPVFPHMWTLTGKENYKWPSKQHCGQIIGWQYHLRLMNQDSWWLGSQSWVSLRNKWWEGAISSAPCKKNINDFNVEISHPSESITQATMKAMSIQVTSTFKPCKDCTLGKAEWQAMS